MAISLKRYLGFAHHVDRVSKKFDLNDREIMLLNMIASANIGQKPILVSDLIYQPIASPAALHTSYKRLIKKKLVSTKDNAKDGRKKELVITELALSYYQQLCHGKSV